MFGAWFTLNGNGEMTGTTWLQESGFLEGPIAITNTHSVGVVRDAILQWQVVAAGAAAVGAAGGGRDLGRRAQRHQRLPREAGARDRGSRRRARRAGRGRQRGRRHRDGLPRLQGRHRHRVAKAARRGRRLHGGRAGPVQLRPAPRPPRGAACRWARRSPTSFRASAPGCAAQRRHERCADVGPSRDADQGSIIVVVATDAPLLPHQLKRIATRAVARRSGAWAAAATTARATSSSPSPPRTRVRPAARRTCASRRCSQRPHQPALRRDDPGHRGGHPERAARAPRR